MEHRIGQTPTEMNEQFQKPDLDLDKYLRRFESESRELYTQRQKIVESLGLRPGMAVADIGAGTGLFTWLIAEKVGTRGAVYAVDISRGFLAYINDQAARRGLGQTVKTILCDTVMTHLAPASIDLAFFSAVYHHLEQPRRILSSVHDALSTRGPDCDTRF